MYRQAIGMERLHVRVLTHRRENIDAYPGEGIEVDTIPVDTRSSSSRMRRYLSCLCNVRYGFFHGRHEEARWWTAQLRDRAPDVALCQYGTTAVRMMPLFRQNKVPTVVHFHGYDISTTLNQNYYKFRLLRALPYFAGIIVVAQYQMQWLVDHGVDASRVRLIPCGVPIDDFLPSSGVDQDSCRFVSVGRFVDKKRHDLMIRAFAECVKTVPTSTLTVIGDGPRLNDCRQLAVELGVTANIELKGIQPIAAVQKELREASVFVLHSMTAENGDKEGWPVALAEAAASGLPIVSTRHASIPEQIEHGISGLLCAEGDWQEMGKHMTQLAKQPSLRKSMGTAARERMKAFDSASQIRSLQDYLWEVASGNS